MSEILGAMSRFSRENYGTVVASRKLTQKEFGREPRGARLFRLTGKKRLRQ